MKRPYAAIIMLIVGLTIIGCKPTEDVQTRYSLEKQLWTAQQLERRISSKYPYDRLAGATIVAPSAADVRQTRSVFGIVDPASS